MHKRYLTLRTATMLSFLVIMLSVLTAFVISNIKDYEWLAKEQGSKLLESLYHNTEIKLTRMLTEPERANRYYEDLVSRYESFKGDDMTEIERITLETMVLVREELPQVSAMSIGNEEGAFVGYRLNEDGSYSLMLIDKRTRQILRIYEGVDTKSEILASFEGYDPRVRPWYEPVKRKPKPQWSEIYVNYDEIMEMTITSLIPIFDQDGVFKGVAGMDIKLNNIAEFLEQEPLKGNGLIYIVDKDWKIVSNSCSEDFVEITGGEPPVAERTVAGISKNTLMQMSAKQIEADDIQLGEVFQLMIDDQRYYGIYASLNKPAELDWRIIAVIPESDLMGTVEERLNQNLVFVILILLGGSVVGMLAFSMITKPIQKSTEAAKRIAEGEWDIELSKGKIPLYEISELVTAFNSMTDKLKQSFNQIQESEKKYRSLVEGSDNDIYTLSVDGTFLSLNKAFETNLRMKKEDIVGKSLKAIFRHEETCQLWCDKLKAVVEEEKAKSFQFDFENELKKDVILNVKLIPIFNTEDKLIHVLGTNTNVTELMEARIQIEQLLKAEKIELERLVQERTTKLEATMKELMEQERLASLGSLVTGVAHEVNTPLGVAVSAGSYLSRSIDELIAEFKENRLTKRSMEEFVQAIEESVEIINGNLKKASELITSFKHISVIKDSEQESDFNIYELIQSILLALKHEYKEIACEFLIDCPKDLVLVGYQNAYSQILTHLMMNSIIHGFKNKKTGTIGITVEKQDEHGLKITYMDNGVGISEEDIKYVFDPFFTSNRTRGGSGLGLNIVYNLVTGRLDGKISCQSKQGEGTQFVMELPVNDLERE